MKKYLLIICILFLIVGVVYFSANGQSKMVHSSKNKLNPKIEIIEKNYMTEEGLIRTYPVTSNFEFLLESQGFYLELLLQQNDKKRFDDQVNVLKKYFIVQVEDDYFIKWKTGLNVTVNAFIDDMRIIHILRLAAVKFHQEDYLTLANKLTASIKKHQIVNNQISHYYDWDSKFRGHTMINSYLSDDYMKILKVDKYPSPSKDGLFYAEKQIIGNEKPISSKEAHMIDQLLTATYCLGKTCENKQFKSWLKKQWDDEKTFYGKYDKDTGLPIVEYESLAVYALSINYFKDSEPSVVMDIKKEKSSLFSKKPDTKTHFFDYVLGVIVSNEE